MFQKVISELSSTFYLISFFEHSVILADRPRKKRADQHMDPDLMMSSAEMGCSQLPEPPRWNTSTTAVYEFEEPVPYEDDKAERSMYDRARMRRALLQSAAESDANAAQSSAVQAGSEQEQQQQKREKKKRRWSARLGATFAGFGKSVKKRTNSWSKRKDSVMAPDPAPVLLSGDTIDLSTSPSQGSGERSRDDDDELSSDDELLLRFTTATTGIQLPSQLASPVRSAASIHFQYPDQAPQPMSAAAEEDTSDEDFDWDYQYKQFDSYGLGSHPQEDLAMLARGVRIAERRGDFKTAARERTFKNLNRLCRTDSAQSQASIGFKAKSARKKTKSDSRFSRWSEFRSLKRLWRKNGAEMRSAEESGSRSEVLRSDEDERSSSREPVATLLSRDSTDEWREGDVEAARFAGWTLQSAHQPF